LKISPTDVKLMKARFSFDIAYISEMFRNI
jgi:hypothetical protein